MLLSIKSAKTVQSVSELVRQYVNKSLKKQIKKQNPLVTVKGIIKNEDLQNSEFDLSQVSSNIDNIVYGQSGF